MLIERVWAANSSRNFHYLVACAETGEALAIDPLQYVEVAEGRGAGGRPLGLREMLRRLRKAAPWLVIGNFSRARAERKGHPSAVA